MTISTIIASTNCANGPPKKVSFVVIDSDTGEDITRIMLA
jgi:hypothetical protein